MKKLITFTFCLLLSFIVLFGCFPKTTTINQLPSQNLKNFNEFLDVSLCQDIQFPGKKIKTEKESYFISDCKRIKGGHILYWYGKDIKPLFIGLAQKYCKNLNGTLTRSLNSISQLKNTPFFQIYKQKEKEIYAMELPRYYKKLLADNFKTNFLTNFKKNSRLPL